MAQNDSIERQVDQLVRKLSRIKEKEIDYAVARALNRTLRAGRTEIAKEIRERTKLPAKIIKTRMYEGKATAKEQAAFLHMYGRPVTAIRLPGIKDTGRYVRGRRGRKGKGVRARDGFRYPGGWIAVSSKNARQQVFSRGEAGVTVEREKMFHHFDEVGKRILQRQMRDNFPKRLKAELAYRLSKLEDRS